MTSSRAEVFSVTNPNEEERMRLAFSQSVDDSAIELRTIMAVEKVLRKVRAFTCLVTGNRAEADEIVEDALILYLSTDPDPDEADVSYRYLISAVRRLMRTTGNRARRGTDLEPELMPLPTCRSSGARSLRCISVPASVSMKCPCCWICPQGMYFWSFLKCAGRSVRRRSTKRRGASRDMVPACASAAGMLGSAG